MPCTGEPPRRRTSRRPARWSAAAWCGVAGRLHLDRREPPGALVLFPFLWLVQMSFRPNDDIFGYALVFSADPRALPRAVDRAISPRSFVNSVVASTSSTALALLLGVPAAYALRARRFRARRADRACGSWPRAWRRRSPSPSRSSSPIAGWACSTRSAGLALIYLTFNLAARDLDDADLLRRRAASAGGGGLDRRLRHLAGLPAGRPCRSPRRASPPPRCSASSCPGTTSSSP